MRIAFAGVEILRDDAVQAAFAAGREPESVQQRAFH
jgi:hypothetical protein